MKNKIGEKKGMLTILEILPHYEGHCYTKLKCKCDCGNDTIVFASHFNSGHTTSCGCAKHQQLKHRKDYSGKRFGNLTLMNPIYGEKYGTKYRCICDCGNIITVYLSALINGQSQCQKCKGKKSSLNNRKDYTGLFSKYGIKYLYPLYSKEHCWYWRCECGICGKEFNANATSVWTGNTKSCGCIKSSREVMIEKFLLENNIKYIREKTFDNCMCKGRLKFDFAIYRNDKLLCLIEYDGEQHYIPVNHWGGKESLSKIQERDQIKNTYCEKNHITLLRLSYKLSDNEIKEKILNTIYP